MVSASWSRAGKVNASKSSRGTSRPTRAVNRWLSRELDLDSARPAHDDAGVLHCFRRRKTLPEQLLLKSDRHHLLRCGEKNSMEPESER